MARVVIAMMAMETAMRKAITAKMEAMVAVDNRPNSCVVSGTLDEFGGNSTCLFK